MSFTCFYSLCHRKEKEKSLLNLIVVYIDNRVAEISTVDGDVDLLLLSLE